MQFLKIDLPRSTTVPDGVGGQNATPAGPAKDPLEEVPQSFSGTLARLETDIPVDLRMPLINAFQEVLDRHKRANSFLNCIDALKECNKDFIDGSRIAGFLLIETKGDTFLIAAPQRHSMFLFGVTTPSHSEILEEFSNHFNISDCKVLGGGRLTFHETVKCISISNPSGEFGPADLTEVVNKIKEHILAREPQKTTNYRFEVSEDYNSAKMRQPAELNFSKPISAVAQ